jgi:hypothetical protein
MKNHCFSIKYISSNKHRAIIRICSKPSIASLWTQSGIYWVAANNFKGQLLYHLTSSDGEVLILKNYEKPDNIFTHYFH